MEVIMEVLHKTIKGGMMNALERFHIYKETKIIKLVKSVG
jgi:hypothetical protein